MTKKEIKRRYEKGFDIKFYSKDSSKYFHYFKEEYNDFYTQDICEDDFNGELVETNFDQELSDILRTFENR